jgi:phosphodiesterase/alkaline phosphatase D-like protein
VATNRTKAGRVTRRRFLEVGSAGAAFTMGGTLASPAPSALEIAPLRPYPFTLGVASGDPLPDGVVLWTRLAPEPLAPDGLGSMPPLDLTVQWEVAADDRFRSLVRRGSAIATAALGHSVHVEVSGLEPAREYHYRFKVGGHVSPAGTTRTAPAPGAENSRLAFALASCQSWVGGRYGAYRTMADEDLDLVVHVGDYIYEHKGTETLADFRLLHAQYKTSVDLRAAHPRFPFVAVFDDHEVENNWAASRSRPDGGPSMDPERFLRLRAAAFQAYYEHLPLRRGARPAGPDMLAYRRLRFGQLAELNVLDTRQYRSPQADDRFIAPRNPRSLDPSQTMTGGVQERWLLDGLRRSRARWNLVAQQTMMAQYDYDPGPGQRINHDQWDGYAAARDRLLHAIGRDRPGNPVVLSGDWHSSFVNDLKADFGDPDSETLATEFVGTSISSACGWRREVEAALHANPHVRFFEGSLHGYVRCTLTPASCRGDYRVVPSADHATAPATTLTSWVVEDGRPGAFPLSAASMAI